jgi:hypothetical protein
MKKTFIVKVVNKDSSVVIIPFSNKTAASSQLKKELKKVETKTAIINQI